MKGTVGSTFFSEDASMCVYIARCVYMTRSEIEKVVHETFLSLHHTLKMFDGSARE